MIPITRFLAGLLLLLPFSFADAAMINEILIEPSGPNQGQQFIELKGTPNESLANLSFLVLIGEEGGSGVVDQVLDLSSFSLGSNGLLLWRDEPTGLLPPPAPETTVVSGGFPFSDPTFFSNLSQTFVLVENFTGSVLDDLDTNNDGVLDVTPWDHVIDAIGIRENDSSPDNEFAFGEQLGFSDFPVAGFDADALFRDGLTNEWYSMDVDNDSLGGPFSFDPLELVDLDAVPRQPSDFNFAHMTPGSMNATTAPEPSSIFLAMLGLATLFLFRDWFALGRREMVVKK